MNTDTLERPTLTPLPEAELKELMVPDHIPRDRIFDLRWATGMVPVSDIEPYTDSRTLLHPDTPRVMYYPYPMVGRMGGAWTVHHYEDIREVYENGDLYSTEGAAAFQFMIGETWPCIPLGIDAPDHTKYRRFLNPYFTPVAMIEMEPRIRAIITEMIDEIAEKGRVDISYDFGRVFPVRVFLGLMGFPMEMFEQFLEWEWEILHSNDFDRMKTALRGIVDYHQEFIAEKRANPDDKLASKIIHGEIEGRPLTEDEIRGTIFFLWLGGLDTVASTISQMFRRLAIDQELQAELRANPEMIPGAVEEFLRTQPLVNSTRKLKRDHEWYGMKMKKGDFVMCINSAGNFDPEQFDHPDQFDMHRKSNRHFTFVGGPHICLGAHLARRELRTLLQEWFKRIPTFRLAPDASLEVVPGLLSVRNLPIEWDVA